MKHFHALPIVMLALTCAAPASAEIYRWVDSSGRVHFSDSPPPDTKQLQQVKSHAQPGDPTAARMREATAKTPVTLYTSDCGEPCNQAAAFLKSRGIAYTTKQVDKDYEASMALRKLIGELQVPVVSIGGTVQKGFERTLWGNLLDVAGYPKPKNDTTKE